MELHELRKETNLLHLNEMIFHYGQKKLFEMQTTNLLQSSSIDWFKRIWKWFLSKGQGRIRYEIGLSSLFQSHQAQLYIEWKLLLMWQFWHENWDAFHWALTDSKKRQKLHFCNKNFKNDFSFPDVFVCNIATTPTSSSYHLIQLFKYYKAMPLSKIRNTGHSP